MVDHRVSAGALLDVCIKIIILNTKSVIFQCTIHHFKYKFINFSANRYSEDRDVITVAAECSNVIFGPHDRSALILDAKVAAAATGGGCVHL